MKALFLINSNPLFLMYKTQANSMILIGHAGALLRVCCLPESCTCYMVKALGLNSL